MIMHTHPQDTITSLQGTTSLQETTISRQETTTSPQETTISRQETTTTTQETTTSPPETTTNPHEKNTSPQGTTSLKETPTSPHETNIHNIPRNYCRTVENCSDEYTSCYCNENLTEILRNISQDQKTLDLSGNEIETITTDSFSNVPNLTSLSLSRNSVSNIELGSLDNLIELKNLELDWNNLTSIPNGLFKNQTKLKNLNLEGNSLQNISGGMWEGLTSLQHLRLTGNHVNIIGPGAFSNLPQLKTVHVGTHTFNTFNVQLLNPSTYPNTKKPPRVEVEDVRTLVCDKKLCRIRKLGDEAVKLLFTLKGNKTRPKCSNQPELYWDEMDCSESGIFFNIFSHVCLIEFRIL